MNTQFATQQNYVMPLTVIPGYQLGFPKSTYVFLHSLTALKKANNKDRLSDRQVYVAGPVGESLWRASRDGTSHT